VPNAVAPLLPDVAVAEGFGDVVEALVGDAGECAELVDVGMRRLVALVLDDL
jgi:hypothetical protein